MVDICAASALHQDRVDVHPDVDLGDARQQLGAAGLSCRFVFPLLSRVTLKYAGASGGWVDVVCDLLPLSLSPTDVPSAVTNHPNVDLDICLCLWIMVGCGL